MTDTNLPRQPVDSTFEGLEKWMTPLLLAPAVLVSVLLAVVESAGSADSKQLLLVAWVLWIPTAVACGSRALWQKGFREGGSRIARFTRFLQRWYGWLGLATTIVILILWATLAPITGVNRYWFASALVLAVGLLFVRGPIRHLGAGALVAAPAPTWLIAIFYGVVVLGLPAIVYIVTMAISAAIARRAEPMGAN